SQQPDSNDDTSNMINYQPLEGFVYAVTPNNFIAINGNLPTLPLMLGNVVIAKPSSDVVYSFNLFREILHKAGVPSDVLAVLYGNSALVSDILMNHKMFAGVHFTGGTDVFNGFWKTVGANIANYNAYPRIVGETGGKDPIVVYDDADPKQVAVSLAVGAFGAQGRKCSSTSRVYMSTEMWPLVRPHLRDVMRQMRTGDVGDFKNFMGAMINAAEYIKVKAYIDRARASVMTLDGAVLEFWGGDANDATGWFIEPAVARVNDPNYESMQEEIFGPFVTVCTLPKEKFANGEVLAICNGTSPYGLTGAVHTSDVYRFCEALHELRYSAGNFYDDRTTAAMVDKQPFSGGRKSGTNSKVGWWPSLMPWVNMQTVCLRTLKTTFPPAYLG
ncbi:MAG: aldehyde dehydrogenase family protein, partial [bacterium]|nr:aldehyde dehydrogenase family protein [bacterium]